MKKAFITGVTGQDGSFLAELLLEKGYDVHAIIRRSSTFNTSRIEHIINEKNLTLHHGDITDSANINKLLSTIKPHEIYNLAAQSHVKVSFEIPEYTAQVDAMGTLRVIEAMKDHCPKAKLYHASTSELFGKVQEIPQTETTPFYPRSPYGVAKLYGFWIIKNYREAYNLFACNGILFNHESERRGKTFLTRKVTMCLSEIYKGKRDILKVGNLNAKRDWGYAKEYVEAMWLMLQQDNPVDLVIATGQTITVRSFIEKAAKYVNYDLVWKGEGVNEKGYDKNSGKLIVEVDPKYFRPTEVDLLIGNPIKAKETIGWEPTTSIDELIKIMMENDIKNA